MAAILSGWPPNLTEEQIHSLTLLASTFALSHGLLYLPATTTPPPTPSSAIHAPFSLLPSPFPRALFGLAQRLQHAYNVLYARIAMDDAFLDRVMGEDEGAGRVDEFTRQLWRGWKQVREEGLAQPLQLGIFRSDYLLHAPDAEASISLKQVEFNTISSSFGPLSERVAELHRYLQASSGYFDCSPHLKAENMPPNRTTSAIVDGLAAAHEAYGVQDAQILFVVQAGERNVFDQRWLEYELLERHGIHTIRQTFDELQSTTRVSPSRTLLITTPLTPNRGIEISTIYFRAGYTPTDFPSPEHYDLRVLLERSRAIKCPSLALQLAGGKMVQQALTLPGVLEHFLLDANTPGPERFKGSDVDAIRASWMSMWTLETEEGVRRARGGASGVVLKPQREGGGNNVYKDAIPPFLDTLPPAERAAWIAMALIEPPEGVRNYLVRSGAGAVLSDVVSELGVFGWALFGGRGEPIKEESGGWLVRTKGRESDEGGVAVGFSVLDSVVLVD